VHPSCQTLDAASVCRQLKLAKAKASLARKGVAVIYAAFPPSTSEPRAGTTELHRTATAVVQANAGKFINQGVSLVLAARPSAGRSPVLAHHAKYRSPIARRVPNSDGLGHTAACEIQSQLPIKYKGVAAVPLPRVARPRAQGQQLKGGT
jgi:hypothetical protein